MRVIKAKYPDGSPIHTTMATSSKEIKILFLMHGIHAWPVKMGGYWLILYPGTQPKFFDPFPKINKLDSMTIKRWLELAEENCPEENRCTPYEEKFCSFFKWPNMKKYVELETLP